MNDLHLRPRTVTELVDAAFTLYRRHPLPYLVGAAIAVSPTVLAALIVGPMVTGAPPTTFALHQLVGWASYVFAIALMLRLGADHYLGGEPDVGAALRRIAPRLPALAASSLLKVPLYILGALALGVGILYVVARWFAVAPAVVLEDKGAIEAFGRSTQLTRGRKRHVLNTLVFVGIISGLIFFGIGAALGIFADEIATMIASTVASILFYPLVGLTMVVLYYDVRIRGEGFDLDRMAEALEAPVATT